MPQDNGDYLNPASYAHRTEAAMQLHELEKVLDALARLAGGWNDAAADDDRGRTNHAVTLTVFDDGSGRIGQRKRFACPGDADTEDLHHFDNAEGLAKILIDYGEEVFGERDSDV